MRVIDCPDCDYSLRSSATFYCYTCHNIGKVRVVSLSPAPIQSYFKNTLERCNCGNTAKQTSAGCPVHGVIY